MAVPKHRNTKSKRNKRRMHLFLKGPVLAVCPKCKKPVRPHTICHNCGYYKGREVIDVLTKLEKKERKEKQKELQSAEKAQQKEKLMDLEELSKKKF